MKFIKRLLNVFLVLFLVGSISIDSREIVEAHPGNTDAYGCHTCWTNCAKWGLSTGEYHCHGGSSPSSGSSNNNNTYNSSSYSYQQQLLAEQERQRQEELKKQQELLRQQQIQAEKDDGYSKGYNYKLSNPDADKESMEGKSENYIAGYDEGFSKALNELRAKTLDEAKKNAKKDSEILDEPDLTVPEGLIKDYYLSQYEYYFDTYEEDFFKDIKNDARASALIDAYNYLGPFDYSDEIPKKAQKVHSRTYKKYYKSYSDNIENLKSSAREKGKEDGEDFLPYDLSDFDPYEDYAMYKDIVEEYQDGYSYGRNSKIAQYSVFILVLALLVLYIIQKKRKKELAIEKAENVTTISERSLGEPIESKKIDSAPKNQTSTNKINEDHDKSSMDQEHVSNSNQNSEKLESQLKAENKQQKPKEEDNIKKRIRIKKKFNIEPETKVKHIKFGKGKVTKVEGKYFTVKFSSHKESKFIFPEAFEKGYLELLDNLDHKED